MAKEVKQDIDGVENEIPLNETLKSFKELVDQNATQINELNGKLNLIDAKVQASVDYTDDLIATANNVLTHSDTVLTFYLGAMSLVSVIVIALFSAWINKRKEDHTREAIETFLASFAKDETLQEDVVKRLVSHPNIAENIETAINGIATEMAKNHVKQGLEDIMNNLDKSK